MESIKSSYHFGPYHLVGRECVLLRDGRPVALTPKAFDTLLVLVRNNGHLVDKDELMNQVWPETSVEEANLTQNIFTLRRILGESESSKYIETVPRRGYRFVAAVREVLAPELANSATVERHEAKGQVSDLASERRGHFLAVLPFTNTSADPNMEYLSDGITESIINSLSQLPQLRVISRSTVFRYKVTELDAQQIGRELGVDAVLVGMVRSQGPSFLISAELVDVANGWQLWGEKYDRGSKAILEVQEEIARQISGALRLKLTGDEEQKLTKRYTESPEAYKAYLEGRYHWSKYTREGLEQAIVYFRKAIDVDARYALAYAGIVDCYLRLATNYMPPEDALLGAPPPLTAPETHRALRETNALSSMELRYDWDQKAAEREQKRATELSSNYPATHQWHAAYLFAMNLFFQSQARPTTGLSEVDDVPAMRFDLQLRDHTQLVGLTPSEEVQIFCAIAREQIDVGNYEAGCAVLHRRWTLGEWPTLEGLSTESSADLLFTAGALAGYVGSTRQVPKGQKHAEALLNGSIALCEQLGSRTRSAEGRIELGWCYFREGLYDLARDTLEAALHGLKGMDRELRSLALIRAAVVERYAGRLHDSVSKLRAVSEIVELAGTWATGRYHLELATTLKGLAIAESCEEYIDQALEHFHKGLYEFQAIGNHRFAAIVENNHGYLLLTLKRLDEAEGHLASARKLFDGFADKVRRAQVDETLAQLNIAAERFDLAEQCILRSVETLETGGEEALLAESLTTQGLVFCRLSRHREAKQILSRAHEVAERCGDGEGAGRPLLIMIEEMFEQLADDERLELGARLAKLLAGSQRASLQERLRKGLDLINEAHALTRPTNT